MSEPNFDDSSQYLGDEGEVGDVGEYCGDIGDPCAGAISMCQCDT